MTARSLARLSLLAMLVLVPAAARAGEVPSSVAVAAVDEAAPEGLVLGALAPMSDVKMKAVDGKELAIDDIRGKKGTLVMFSCNACPWAKAWEKRIVEIGNTYPKKGIGVVVINSNDPNKVSEDGYTEMKKRAKERSMRFPYVMDLSSDIARAFGASKTPEAYLFDAEGKLVYHGAVDDNAKEPAQVKETYLRNALDAVAGGKAVSVAETKAMGCSIKFRPKV